MDFQAIPRWGRACVERLLKPAGIAAVFVLAALLATFPLQRRIAYPFVFLFLCAIMGSAWTGGALAGVLAVVFSSLAVNYFFIPPYYSMTVAKEAQSFFATFILSAIVVSLVSLARKRAERAVRQANDLLESMVRARTAELETSYKQIRERERHLRELTEAIPQQIWRASAAGQVEYLNSPLRRYLGAAAAEPPEGLFARILHPDDAPLFAAAWSRALDAGERFELEARVAGDDGGYRWFLLRASPQRSSDGSIAAWYGTHIDIEEQRRAQQRLVGAQEDLGRLEKNLLMAEMAASIAHELNQPLTAVVTHAYACREWLRGQPANLERASLTAEKIVQESTRASDVVRRVRALFQKEPPACQSADLNALIQEMARILREEAIRRAVSIRLELADGLPLLDVDPVLIQQVLLNLALNGMEAMRESAGERELLIRSCLDAEAAVLVSVEDCGPGVAPEQRSRIFEPFYSTRPEGTGMGLAICRSIIEAHGGRLTVAEAASGGAQFQFTLRARS